MSTINDSFNQKDKHTEYKSAYDSYLLSSSNKEKFDAEYKKLTEIRHMITHQDAPHTSDWRNELSVILSNLQTICNEDTKER